MEERIQQAFAALPQESKDYLQSDEMKQGCAEIYKKAGGPLSREKVAKIRESFTAFVIPHLADDVKEKVKAMALTPEQKDAVWAKASAGNETIELPAFVKLTFGVYTGVLAKGVSLENLRKYNAEWRAGFSL